MRWRARPKDPARGSESSRGSNRWPASAMGSGEFIMNGSQASQHERQTMGNSVKLKRYAHKKGGGASWQVEPEVAAWLSACEIAKAAIDCPSEDVIVNVLSGLRDAGFDLNDPLPHREHLDLPGQTLAMSVARFHVLHGEEIGVPAVAALIRLGVDLSAIDPIEKISPMQSAAGSGLLNVVKAMADAGVSLLGRKDEAGIYADAGDAPLARLLESSHRWGTERFANRSEAEERSKKEGDALLACGFSELDHALSKGLAKREDWLPALGAAALQGMMYSNDSRSQWLERLDEMGLDWLAPIEDTKSSNEYGRRRLEALGVDWMESPTLALAAWDGSMSLYGNCKTAWEVLDGKLKRSGPSAADPRAQSLAKINLSEMLGDSSAMAWEDRAEWLGRMASMMSNFKALAKKDCSEQVVMKSQRQDGDKLFKAKSHLSDAQLIAQCLAASDNGCTGRSEEWNALKRREKSSMAKALARKTHELGEALGGAGFVMGTSKSLAQAGQAFAKAVLDEGAFNHESDVDVAACEADPAAALSPRVEASMMALKEFSKLGSEPADCARSCMLALGAAAVKACSKSEGGRMLAAAAAALAWLQAACELGCPEPGKIGSAWIGAIKKMDDWLDDGASACMSRLEAKLIEIDIGQAPVAAKKSSLRV